MRLHHYTVTWFDVCDPFAHGQDVKNTICIPIGIRNVDAATGGLRGCDGLNQDVFSDRVDLFHGNYIDPKPSQK